MGVRLGPGFRGCLSLSLSLSLSLIYTHIYVHIYICILTCLQHIYIYIHACMHAYMHTYICLPSSPYFGHVPELRSAPEPRVAVISKVGGEKLAYGFQSVYLSGMPHLPTWPQRDLHRQEGVVADTCFWCTPRISRREAILTLPLYASEAAAGHSCNTTGRKPSSSRGLNQQVFQGPLPLEP